MIQRPLGVSAFEFVVLAALRSAQLVRGCTPRVDGGHKITTTALLEVAAGKVARVIEVVELPVVPELVPSVSTL
jgi:DNA-directed RNA polymerase subunit K/omega